MLFKLSVVMLNVETTLGDFVNPLKVAFYEV
jgi:hypothetical protein